MKLTLRLGCVAVGVLAIGCSGQTSRNAAPQPVFDEFVMVLSGLEQAIETAASAGSRDDPELTDDLRHRVGKLEESVSELLYRASNKADAQTTLNAMSQTLADARNATDGILNLSKLCELVGKLKVQAEELKPKL